MPQGAGHLSQYGAIDDLVGEGTAPFGSHHARLTQGARVVTDQGLGEGEIVYEMAYAQILAGQALHDAPSDRLPEECEESRRRHRHINGDTDRSCCISRGPQAHWRSGWNREGRRTRYRRMLPRNARSPLDPGESNGPPVPVR